MMTPVECSPVCNRGDFLTGRPLYDLVCARMHIANAREKIQTELGILAWKADWIAEFAYLARINFPLTDYKFLNSQYILSRKSLQKIGEIFVSFNGIDLFNGIFSIFGESPNFLDRSDFYVSQNVPYNIVNLNNIWRPSKTPSDIFLFATFGDGLEDFIDGVDPDGNIVSGRFKHSQEIIERWTSLEDWIGQRCSDSITEFFLKFPNQRSKFAFIKD